MAYPQIATFAGVPQIYDNILIQKCADLRFADRPPLGRYSILPISTTDD
jgi:hypothetical protein